jgi:hypothetical protein
MLRSERTSSVSKELLDGATTLKVYITGTVALMPKKYGNDDILQMMQS